MQWKSWNEDYLLSDSANSDDDVKIIDCNLLMNGFNNNTKNLLFQAIQNKLAEGINVIHGL